MTWDQFATRKVTLELPEDEAFVYIAWGRDESRPLYIGKSRNVMARLGQHAQSSPWYVYIDHFDVYGFRSELAALQAEAEAIAELRPEYNKALNLGSEPPISRYRRHRRRYERVTLGEPWPTLDDIPADQLEIIRRVQNRGAST